MVLNWWVDSDFASRRSEAYRVQSDQDLHVLNTEGDWLTQQMIPNKLLKRVGLEVTLPMKAVWLLLQCC